MPEFLLFFLSSSSSPPPFFPFIGAILFAPRTTFLSFPKNGNIFKIISRILWVLTIYRMDLNILFKILNYWSRKKSKDLISPPRFKVRNCFELKYKIMSSPTIEMGKNEKIQYWFKIGKIKVFSLLRYLDIIWNTWTNLNTYRPEGIQHPCIWTWRNTPTFEKK